MAYLLSPRSDGGSSSHSGSGSDRDDDEDPFAEETPRTAAEAVNEQHLQQQQQPQQQFTVDESIEDVQSALQAIQAELGHESEEHSIPPEQPALYAEASNISSDGSTESASGAATSAVAPTNIPSPAVDILPISPASSTGDALSPSMTGRFTVHDVTPTASSRDTPRDSPKAALTHGVSLGSTTTRPPVPLHVGGATSTSSIVLYSESGTEDDDALDATGSMTLQSAREVSVSSAIDSSSADSTSSAEDASSIMLGQPMQTASADSSSLSSPRHTSTQSDRGGVLSVPLTPQTALSATAPARTSALEGDQDTQQEADQHQDDVTEATEPPVEPADQPDSDDPPAQPSDDAVSRPVSPTTQALIAVDIPSSTCSPLETAIFTPSQSFAVAVMPIPAASVETPAAIGTPKHTMAVIESTVAPFSAPSTAASATTATPCCALCSPSHGALVSARGGLYFHRACVAGAVDAEKESASAAAASVQQPSPSAATVAVPPSSQALESELVSLRSQRRADSTRITALETTLKKEAESRLLLEATSMYAVQQQQRSESREATATVTYATHQYQKRAHDYEEEKESSSAAADDTQPLYDDEHWFRPRHVTYAKKPWTTAPYKATLPGLSTAPLITPIAPDAPKTRNYPGTQAADFSFPLLFDHSAPQAPPVPLMPVAADPPGPVIFARDYPSTTLTGRMDQPPEVKSSFAKSMKPTHAPPAWGSRIASNASTRPFQDEFDSGSDWWNTAHIPPQPDEITYDVPTPEGKPVLEPPLHPYLHPTNLGNENYPKRHPLPSNSPMTNTPRDPKMR